MDIKKVVVIGSGTMGSGIAAQIANAGINVTLLDLPSNDGERNQITQKAKERIIKSRPPLLVEKKRAQFIKAGNSFMIDLDASLIFYFIFKIYLFGKNAKKTNRHINSIDVVSRSCRAGLQMHTCSISCRKLKQKFYWCANYRIIC